VSGEELGSLLQDERSLGLAVLNACEGARTSHVDPFSGVASSLVESGIPAVIGMQFEVTDAAAIAFAERLYTALAQGFPVDAALAQARRAIFATGHNVEFSPPVLFLRSGTTRLFEIDTSRPRRTPAKPPAPAPALAPAKATLRYLVPAIGIVVATLLILIIVIIVAAIRARGGGPIGPQQLAGPGTRQFPIEL
jgi:hypothetical protein